MRLIFCFVCISLLVSSNSDSSQNKDLPEKILPVANSKKSFYSKIESIKTLQNKISDTKAFIDKNSNYNRSVAFFIDMHIQSNADRFFVINLKNNEVIKKGLVAHGINSKTGENGEMNFSNEINSFCTALGIYSIGGSYFGKFGKSYKLYGLERSNSNAIKRAIILHQYTTVPDNEQVDPIANSLGCPMVSPRFFNQLENIIDKSPRKIILRIYY